MPPNKGMELTVKSDTPFAKRRAKGAPLLPAAHPRRSASFKRLDVTMTWRIAIAFALGLCSGGFGLAATINNVAIVDAVNAKLPSDAQFDPWGLSFTKTQRLHREYRRLYPEGRLLWREGTLWGLGFLCVLVAALFMGLGFIVIVWPGSFGALMLWFTYFRR